MFGQKTDKPASSGMEIMLRSMGLGEVLDMAKKLAEDGTLAKILAYADSAEKILAALERVEHELKRISPPGDGSGYDAPQPGTYPPNGGPVIAPLRLLEGCSSEDGHDGPFHGGRLAGNGAAHPGLDARVAGHDG